MIKSSNLIQRLVLSLQILCAHIPIVIQYTQDFALCIMQIFVLLATETPDTEW